MTESQKDKLRQIVHYRILGEYSDGSILIDWVGEDWVVLPDAQLMKADKYESAFPTMKIIPSVKVDWPKTTKKVFPTGEIAYFSSEEKPKKEKKPKEVKLVKPLTDHQNRLLHKHGDPKIIKQLKTGDILVEVSGEKRILGYDGIDLPEKEFKSKYKISGEEYIGPLGYFYSGKTVCQESPHLCKPREIEHVAWDADHTIWNLKSGIASSVTGELKKVSLDEVIEIRAKTKYKSPITTTYYKDYLTGLALEEGWFVEPGQILEEVKLSEKTKELAEITDALMKELPEKEQEKLLPPPETSPAAPKSEIEHEETNRITLLPSFRDTLDKLESQGIKSSVISLNTPGSVVRLLKAFGLADRFVEIRDSHENKGKVFKEITKKHNFCPCRSIFIDDTKGNVEDVTKECGLGLQIGKGKDVEKPIDIFQFIKEH